MTIPPEAVKAATKAFGDHVKAHSIPEPKGMFSTHLTYALNPSAEECLTVALEAALPHLPRVMRAQEWFEEALTEARAQGIRDAATNMPSSPPLIRRWRVKAWLLDLANTIHPKPQLSEVGTDD